VGYEINLIMTNTGKTGRPNLRWMDGVMRDAERLGVRNWRIKAKDRDDWRRLLESAKTLHGL